MVFRPQKLGTLKGFHENVVSIGYIHVYFGKKAICIRTPIRGKYQ